MKAEGSVAVAEIEPKIVGLAVGNEFLLALVTEIARNDNGRTLARMQIGSLRIAG